MDQSKREKIALFVFLALVAASLLVITAYIERAGSSWNSTATSIDDARGELLGYAALVYRGTAVPSAKEASRDEGPVPVSSVVESYRNKGASVLQLDVLHPETYEGDDIYYVAHKRVGVFFVSETSSQYQVEREVEYFADHGVDYVVCIAQDSSLVAKCKLRPDIVVSLGVEGAGGYGTMVEGTYYTHVPSVGKVGAVLISPDNSVSAKTLSNIPA